MVTTGKWRRKYGSLKGKNDPRIVIYGYEETEQIAKELKMIGVNLSAFAKDAFKIHYFYCKENDMLRLYMPESAEVVDDQQTTLFD